MSEKPMLSGTINFEGTSEDDCLAAIEEVLKSIAEGFTSGSGGNDNSSYFFDISDKTD